MDTEQQAFPAGRMGCGHSARYRYDRNHDPDSPCADDRAEDWGCSICDMRDLRIRLRRAEGSDAGRPPCYFALERDLDEDAHGWFYIVTQEFWDEYGHLDDQSISAEIRLPDGFNEVMESVFAFEDGTPAEGRDALLAAGLEESTLLLP